MRLKNTAFIKNVTVKTTDKKTGRLIAASTCDWGQEIGQGKNAVFSKQGVDPILAAMVYYKIDNAGDCMSAALKDENESGKKTKPLKSYKNMKFPLAAVISNVYLDGDLLKKQTLGIFLQIKNNKCFLKFNDTLEYKGSAINSNCVNAISRKYGSDSSWAILKMEAKIEKEGRVDVCNLHLYGIKIDNEKHTFDSPSERDAEFERLWEEQHSGLALEDFPQKNEEKKKRGPRPEFSPSQVIYYGVPGSGKSWLIRKELEKKGITEKNGQMLRVVFHPDYSNADFVGQILPVVKNGKGVDYQFKPGPFTRILRDAYENGDKEYALVVEEINRGNAAAIFGDLFQLLDRIPEKTNPEKVNENLYGPGWSCYCIMNDYINAYFREEKLEDGSVVVSSSNVLYDISVNENVGIRLPPNLSIYATMNSSDQNVFSLDNAFQRRWEMRRIPNEFVMKDKNQAGQYNQTIRAKEDELWVDTKVKWGEFHDRINQIIVDLAQKNALSSMEDKRLGCWFIVPKNEPGSKLPIISSDAFAEKVLKYLWDDAFKFDRDKIFEDDEGKEFKSLDDLIKAFKREKFKVFKDPDIKKWERKK